MPYDHNSPRYFMQGEILWLIIICTYLSVGISYLTINIQNYLSEFLKNSNFFCKIRAEGTYIFGLFNFSDRNLQTTVEFYQNSVWKADDFRTICIGKLLTLADFAKWVSKGGVISEGIFCLVPSSKKLNQITIPELFNIR